MLFPIWLGRSPGEGKDYLLQYSGLENSMDCIVHGATRSIHSRKGGVVFFSAPSNPKGVTFGGESFESVCNAGNLGSIPGLGRSPGEGKGYLLQYSGLENSMDYTVHGMFQARILECVATSFSRALVSPVRPREHVWLNLYGLPQSWADH